jgi:hypothetical protein
MIVSINVVSMLDCDDDIFGLPTFVGLSTASLLFHHELM